MPTISRFFGIVIAMYFNDHGLAWAELHQADLLENWRLARIGETLREIDPLQ